MDSRGATSVLEQAPTSTLAERRLQAEWKLLDQLATLNPTRLVHVQGSDCEFQVALLGTSALLIDGVTTRDAHKLRIVFPRFYPSVPMELYLDQPVFHPNVHPLTGFVCLWDRHRISNTVEHALHKTVAILGWQLLNRDPRHVMQPRALELESEGVAGQLQVQPLTGIAHRADYYIQRETHPRRRLF